MNDKNLSAELAAAPVASPNAESVPASSPRYCPMCDEYMKPRECKACGMPTEKVPNGDV